MLTCNMCGDRDVSVRIEGMGTWHCYEPTLGEPFPYKVALCLHCGHVFGAWDEDHTPLYTAQEYVTCDTDLPVYCAYVSFTLAGLAPRRRPLKVLEVGFNRGALLKHYYDLGFDCYGVEPGRENVEAARKKMPRATLDQGYFDENWARRFPQGTFDLVIITSVFEHLPQPDRVTRAFRRCMAPDGRLFLVVPDLSFYAPTLQVPRADRDRYGCSQLLFFYRNVFLTYAQHINHFSGPSLTRYLAAFGLQTLQVANVANIWVLAAPAAAGDDSFAYPDLVKYHSAMIDHYERMLAGMRRAIVDKLQGRRLVCYGAGRDFGYSQDVFRPLGIEALAVADDTVMSPRVHGVPCVRPEALASFEPEICLATSYDYEHEIAKKARRVLPESTEVLTLTELMYEAEWTMPRFTNYMLKPALEPCTPVRS